jgi:hypothetical protein
MKKTTCLKREFKKALMTVFDEKTVLIISFSLISHNKAWSDSRSELDPFSSTDWIRINISRSETMP